MEYNEIQKIYDRWVSVNRLKNSSESFKEPVHTSTVRNIKNSSKTELILATSIDVNTENIVNRCRA